jgi:hypothetical protein
MTAEELLQFRELCVVIIAERDEARYPGLVRQYDEMIDKEESEAAH